MNKSSLSREKYIDGWSVVKKSKKCIQCQKGVDLQKVHLAKAAAAAITVNKMLQESQAEAVSLETPRQEQWRESKTCWTFSRRVISDEKTEEIVEIKVQEIVAKAKVYEESESGDGKLFP